MATFYEEKLLDTNYIETQILSIPEIKKGVYGYKIKHSDNPNSSSIYITFTHQISNGYVIKGSQFRISDHTVKNWNEAQMIIKQKTILSTKRKKTLMSHLKNTLNKSKMKFATYCANRVDSYNTNKSV